MSSSFDQLPPRQALVAIARDFHRRGWMSGTAGNLSARCDDDSFWLTASGHPKGQLEERDFVLVDVASGKVLEQPVPGARPSAEAAIHQVVYQLFPEARACLHVHSVDACIAANRFPAEAQAIPLPPLEMIKGLGIWEQSPDVDLPLFANWLEVPRIAIEIARRFNTQPPQVPALMIRGHGITVWGSGLQEAYNRVEIVEFLLSYLARR